MRIVENMKTRIINRGYRNLYKKLEERDMDTIFLERFCDWYDANKRIFKFDLEGSSVGCNNILDYFGVGIDQYSKRFMVMELHDKNFTKRSWRFVTTLLHDTIKTDIYSSYTSFDDEYRYMSVYEAKMQDSYGMNRIRFTTLHSIISNTIIEYVKYKVQKEGMRLHEAIPDIARY